MEKIFWHSEREGQKEKENKTNRRTKMTKGSRVIFGCPGFVNPFSFVLFFLGKR